MSDAPELEIACAAILRWRARPDLFAREVLGTDLWSKQIEIANAVRDNSRVAAKSCHKAGKTKTAAVIALWFVCLFPEAKVILTSSSYRQVKLILWKEIVQLYNRARWPLGGTLHVNPEAGLQFPDGRMIVGFSTTDPERMAGFSGKNLLFLVDEASGVPDAIFQAIEGNRAGGAKVLLISNPTQLAGVFYEAFTKPPRANSEGVPLKGWTKITISAWDVPPGVGALATREWCEEMLAEWGGDDPRYAVRVLGQFPTQGDRSVIPLASVENAIERQRRNDVEPVGALRIGVDVARFGTDNSVIQPSRGDWAAAPTVLKGFDVVQVAGEVARVARENRRGNERVRANIDSAVMGAGVVDILSRDHAWLDVVPISSSSSATAEGFERMRDQLWFSMRDWLKTASIPDDADLRGDLIAPTYDFAPNGRMKVESKLDMRKRLGRSTDRGDALALAVYDAPANEPSQWSMSGHVSLSDR